MRVVRALALTRSSFWPVTVTVWALSQLVVVKLRFLKIPGVPPLVLTLATVPSRDAKLTLTLPVGFEARATV